MGIDRARMRATARPRGEGLSRECAKSLKRAVIDENWEAMAARMTCVVAAVRARARYLLLEKVRG